MVGGGPVGAACARELALAGRRVLVLEPGGELGQGWRAAAGMLAPQIEAEDEDPLLAALGYDPVALDTLIERTGMGPAELGARLLDLELEGRVARLPGQRFQRIARA